MALDQRDLDVLIKIHQEGMAETLAAIKALTDAIGDGKGGNNASSLSGASQSLAQRFGALFTVQNAVIAGVVLATTVFAPFTAALLANIANIAAMTVIGGVAVGTIGALGAAIFSLGVANAGGLNPAAEMIKTQKALEAAVKEHKAALDELQQVQAGGGKDLYGSGLSQKQMLNIAQTYVGVTGANVADAQRNLAEPMSGLGGPIAGLGTAIDDMHDHFERASRKIADAIATFLLPYVSKVQELGDKLIQWFGARLPEVFQFASGIIKELGKDFGAAGTEIGKIVDYVLSHQAEFIGFFGDIVKVGVGAFVFLLQAAVNIHEWFKQNWPTILGFIKAFLDGFKVWGPIIGPLLQGIGQDLGNIAKNINTLQPLWAAMGAGIGLMATAALGVLQRVLDTLTLIIDGFKWIAAQAGPTGGPGQHPQAGYWTHPGRGGTPQWVPGNNVRTFSGDVGM